MPESPSRRLEGRVAIVTGGAKGLGMSIARALAAEGAAVGLVARDATRGEAVAAEMCRDGYQALFVTADLAHEDEVGAAVDEVSRVLGTPQVLVNNAALTPSTAGRPSGTAVDIDLSIWTRFLDVNLTGALLMARHTVPRMMEAGGGSIVNINSLVAIHPRRADVGYVASKAALSGLTRAMALDFAPHVRVNELITGFIPNSDNPLHVQLVTDETARAGIIDANLVGRLGDAQDVARTCVFLASDDSGFITGQSIVLDGGAHVAMRTISGGSSRFDARRGKQ